MRILILGAGQVGTALVEYLSKDEDNNITIVDWEAFCEKYNFLPDYVDDSHTSRIQELKEEYELLIHERNKKSKIEDFNL